MRLFPAIELDVTDIDPATGEMREDVATAVSMAGVASFGGYIFKNQMGDVQVPAAIRPKLFAVVARKLAGVSISFLSGHQVAAGLKPILALFWKGKKRASRAASASGSQPKAPHRTRSTNRTKKGRKGPAARVLSFDIRKLKPAPLVRQVAKRKLRTTEVGS